MSELGLTVAEITPQLRDRFAIAETTSGVAVLDVGEDVAKETLIEEGDVIVGDQRQKVSSARTERIRDTFDAADEGGADLQETGNLRAVQLLLGHGKMDSTVRYLGIELEDALAIAEGIEI